MRVFRRFAPWVVLLALVFAPAAGIVALVNSGQDLPAALRPTATPVLAEPTRTTGDDPVDAILRTSVGIAPSLLSPGGTGIVTQVFARPGRELANGDPVFAADGVSRFALAAKAPPYRELVVGSRGPDVAGLERFLAAVGVFSASPDEVYDASTGAAVLAFRRMAGDPEPATTFAPQLVVWLPASPFPVGEVPLIAGEPVPAAGEAVVTGIAPVRPAGLTRPDKQPLDISWPRVVELGGRPVGTVSDPAKIPARIAQAAAAAEVAGAPEDGPSADMRSAPVVLRLPEPVSGLTVPAAAVMVDASGARTCVWVAAGTAYESVPVTVVGGSLGSAALDGPIDGKQVLGNPLAVLSEPECPSS